MLCATYKSANGTGCTALIKIALLVTNASQNKVAMPCSIISHAISHVRQVACTATYMYAYSSTHARDVHSHSHTATSKTRPPTHTATHPQPIPVAIAAALMAVVHQRLNRLFACDHIALALLPRRQCRQRCSRQHRRAVPSEHVPQCRERDAVHGHRVGDGVGARDVRKTCCTRLHVS